MPEAEYAEEFGFAVGDHVLVRIRENDRLVAKFVAEVLEFQSAALQTGPPQVRLDLPGSRLATMSLRPHDAEFEVVDPDEVSF